MVKGPMQPLILQVFLLCTTCARGLELRHMWQNLSCLMNFDRSCNGAPRNLAHSSNP